MGDSDEGGFRRRDVLKTVGLAGLLGAASDVTIAEPSREPGPRPNELLVGMESGVSQSTVESSVQDALPSGSEIVGRIEQLGVMAVKLPEAADSGTRADTKQLLESKPGVRYAEDNPTASYIPNDPYLGDGIQYAPQQVNAPEAWDDTLGSSDVTIAVVDGGIQYTHQDLADVAIEGVTNHGKDFANDDGDPAPEDPTKEYHGSHVAGIACGATDDGEGMAGISNCSLLCCRALGTDGYGSVFDVAEAIVYATDQGADVINLSLGGSTESSTRHDAIKYAWNNGALPIAAAGNDSKEFGEQYTDDNGNTYTYHQYPAEYPECMCVSAVDSSESFASFSSFGEEVDVTAPGVDVLSSVPQEYVDANYGSGYAPYLLASGTSMATPVVAGVAGLTFARHPYMSNDDVRNWIEQNATDLGLSTKEQGDGQVDADAVMDVPDHDHIGDKWTGSEGIDVEASAGNAIKARTTSSSAGDAGVLGISESEQGYGLHGRAVASTGENYGLWGLTKSDQGTGMYGEATSTSGQTYGVRGISYSPGGFGVKAANYAESGSTVGAYGIAIAGGDGTSGVVGAAPAQSGNETYGIKGSSGSSNGYGVYSDGDLKVEGDIKATGEKNFVQTVSTDAGQQDVAYTAVEAGEVRTEASGSAELEDGVAIIDLPDHFEMVTSEDEDLLVQVTPHSADTQGLAVTERSTERIVVEELAGGDGDFEFSYTVKGTRAGHEDPDIVRETTAGPDTPDGPQMPSYDEK